MEKLFCDCKTDAEKSAFFLSGRAVETGVIAAAISNDVAMAYHRCDEFKKEVDALRTLVVMRFDHDYPPQFTQGHNLHELTEPVTAEHCRWFVAEIERLRTDCDALRAKIEQMEQQEPVAEWVENRFHHCPQLDWTDGYKAVIGEKLYALPGAKGE